MSTAKPWAPDRRDIIWINFNPQAGKKMRDLHPMLVLLTHAHNKRTAQLIGLPISTATSNAANPFAVDNSKATGEASYIICNQPKSFDWRLRGANSHPWGKVR